MFETHGDEVSLFTAKAEYVSTSDASWEVVWLQKLLSHLFDSSLEPIVIHCDNWSCIKILENPVFHNHSKHMEMRYHYVRDMVQRRAISLRYVPTNEQTADVLTKPLYKTKFEYFWDKLGVLENAPVAEREGWSLISF